ncbi:MAG: hypothetical protein KatS3mg038_3347 [Candidatus Kapaibacterium sp.]|nr:MAG: hypothetical protein KatS3mg038_3347 [Candidatus Kapabacteria bacterium]
MTALAIPQGSCYNDVSSIRRIACIYGARPITAVSSAAPASRRIAATPKPISTTQASAGRVSSASRSSRRDVLDCTGRDGLRRLAAAYVRAADDDTLDDLRSLCWDRAQACGRDPDEIDMIDELADRWAGEMVFHVLEDEHGVLDAICRHYDWIVYEDDYPEGCVTWLYTGRSPIDLLTEVTYGSQVFSGRV